jgi:DNA-binding MarR family transcriptional regulator
MPVKVNSEPDTATRLRTVVGRLSRGLRGTVAGAGLTPTQISVLASVVRHGPIKVADLGALEGLNATMLSRAVSNLGKAGLVSRSRDEEDARAVWVRATASGRQTQQRIRSERSRALGTHLEQLPAEHRRALEKALPALEMLAESLTARES